MPLVILPLRQFSSEKDVVARGLVKHGKENASGKLAFLRAVVAVGPFKHKRG